MDFNDFIEMTSTKIEVPNKVNADIDMMSNTSEGMNTGFSTPPSSSLDTCDSGFTDLYSNNFTLIKSTNSSICSKTTQTKIGDVDDERNLNLNQSTDSELDSFELSDKVNFDADNKPNIVADNIDKNCSNEEYPSVSECKSHQTAGTSSNCGNDNVKSSDYEENQMDEFNDDSNASDISDLSDVFKLNADILPEMQRSINWVHLQIASGVNPRDCLSRIFQNSPRSSIPKNISDNDLWRVIAAILSDPPRRHRLPHMQTIENVRETIIKSKNIIVLTGAGVSVSCGIPDFRSRDGIYDRLRVEYPDMRDPQSMFDIGYFSKDPRPFYQFAKEIYPGQFQPSLSHQFIKLLESKGKLLRNYTQNIDTLERVAGIENVIECHGSFATASCTRCKYRVDADEIKDDIFHQRIPMCKICSVESTKDFEGGLMSLFEQPFNYNQLVAAGVMKPDIVFFGESLPDKFHSTIESDKMKCDLLIVIGSSLKVRPVALIPSSINASIPQILINREQLDHFTFDVELLGDSDIVINQLCHLLGDEWNQLCTQEPLQTTNKLIARPNNDIPPLLSSAEFVTAEVINTSDTTKTLSSISEDANAEIGPSPILSQPQNNSDTSNSEQTSLSSSPIATTSVSVQPSEFSDTESSQCEIQSKIRDETQTVSEFLPEKSYYYNSKHSYIFPGAELWWKDSDNESVSSDSSSGDDDDVTDIEIDNIRNELEQSYTAQGNSHLNSTYDMFFSNDQSHKDNDSSSCSSNQYDSTTDSGTIQTVDGTTSFGNSTVTATAAATTTTTTTTTIITTAIPHSPDPTISSITTDLPTLRKRSATPTDNDMTSTCSMTLDGIDAMVNVQKRMKLSEKLLVPTNSVNSNDISEN